MDSHKTWKRTVDSDDKIPLDSDDETVIRTTVRRGPTRFDSDDEIPIDSDDETVHRTVHRVDSDDEIPDDEIPYSCA